MTYRTRHSDPLTYRYPRNTIDAFGCDAYSAQAIYRYRTPLSHLVAKLMIMLTISGAGVILALYYFDILVK